MAKKRKSRKSVPVVDDTVIENGVAVSRAGKDHGPDHLWSKGRYDADELVLQEIQAAARERRAKVARRLDILEWLLNTGGIDRRAYDAGRTFKSFFDQASLSGYPSSACFVWKAGGLQQDGTLDIMWRARHKVQQAIELMGGNDTQAARAVWELVGKDRSLKDISGSNRAVSAAWRAGLIAGLNILADHYHPIMKK
jgi:hypothetical protein